MTFGEKVQLLRKNNNMSQETLANMIRINRNYLSRIETGKSEANLSVIKSVASLFNVDANSLIGIDNDTRDKKEKIKEISTGCNYLLDKDLDLVIRIVSILREEYVKRNLSDN